MKVFRAFAAVLAVATVVAVWWQYLVAMGDTPAEAPMFVGCVFAIDLLVAYFANQRRNRGFYNWLAVSLLVTPVLGFILAACSRTLPAR